MTPWEKKLAQNPPGKIVRKTSRAATGGAALFLAFLAFMLLRFGTGTGTGGGTDTKAGSSDPAVPGDENSRPAMVSSQAAPSAASARADAAVFRTDVSPSLSADEQKALGGNILTLLIDERSYLMQIPATGDPIYRPVTLERAVELAAFAAGDSNGIKVRILRRENARASAEEKLKLEFSRRGVTDSAVLMPDSLLP